MTDLTHSAPAELGQALKNAFRSHPAGVALVCARDEHGPVGLLASSVVSVSLHPPLVALSVSTLGANGRRMAACASLQLHLLTAGDIELATHFGTPGTTRFDEGPRWTTAPTGEPVFAHHGARLHGHVTARVPAGEAELLVVELDEVVPAAGAVTPLAWAGGVWHELA